MKDVHPRRVTRSRGHVGSAEENHEDSPATSTHIQSEGGQEQSENGNASMDDNCDHVDGGGFDNAQEAPDEAESPERSHLDVGANAGAKPEDTCEDTGMNGDVDKEDSSIKSTVMTKGASSTPSDAPPSAELEAIASKSLLQLIGQTLPKEPTDDFEKLVLESLQEPDMSLWKEGATSLAVKRRSSSATHSDTSAEPNAVGPIDLKTSRVISSHIVDYGNVFDMTRQYTIIGMEREIGVVNDDSCISCGGPGRLLCCDGCTHSYHLECIDPFMDRVPKGRWFCPVCELLRGSVPLLICYGVPVMTTAAWRTALIETHRKRMTAVAKSSGENKRLGPLQPTLLRVAHLVRRMSSCDGRLYFQLFEECLAEIAKLDESEILDDFNGNADDDDDLPWLKDSSLEPEPPRSLFQLQRLVQSRRCLSASKFLLYVGNVFSHVASSCSRAQRRRLKPFFGQCWDAIETIFERQFAVMPTRKEFVQFCLAHCHDVIVTEIEAESAANEKDQGMEKSATDAKDRKESERSEKASTTAPLRSTRSSGPRQKLEDGEELVVDRETPSAVQMENDAPVADATSSESEEEPPLRMTRSRAVLKSKVVSPESKIIETKKNADDADAAGHDGGSLPKPDSSEADDADKGLSLSENNDSEPDNPPEVSLEHLVEQLSEYCISFNLTDTLSREEIRRLRKTVRRKRTEVKEVVEEAEPDTVSVILAGVPTPLPSAAVLAAAHGANKSSTRGPDIRLPSDPTLGPWNLNMNTLPKVDNLIGYHVEVRTSKDAPWSGAVVIDYDRSSRLHRVVHDDDGIERNATARVDLCRIAPVPPQRKRVVAHRSSLAGAAFVGWQIEVLWKDYGSWHAATVLGFDEASGLHSLEYFMGALEDVSLSSQTYRLIGRPPKAAKDKDEKRASRRGVVEATAPVRRSRRVSHGSESVQEGSGDELDDEMEVDVKSVESPKTSLVVRDSSNRCALCQLGLDTNTPAVGRRMLIGAKKRGKPKSESQVPELASEAAEVSYQRFMSEFVAADGGEHELRIHLGCALWSPQVHETLDGALKGMDEALAYGRKTKCAHCKATGATLTCMVNRCYRSYHYPCSLEVGSEFLDGYQFVCPVHKGNESELPADDAVKSEVVPEGAKKRRGLDSSKCLECSKQVDWGMAISTRHGSNTSKDTINCARCARPFHLRCLPQLQSSQFGLSGRELTSTDLPHPCPDKATVDMSKWTCDYCKVCSCCGGSEDADRLIFCFDCDRHFHMSCVSPPLKRPPRGIWRCPTCIKCVCCGTRTAGSGPSCKWFYDYTLCAACGRLYNNSNFCPVCRKVYRDNDYATPMIQCDSCSRWVHLTCAGVEENAYDDLGTSDSIFHCVLCRVPPEIGDGEKRKRTISEAAEARKRRRLGIQDDVSEEADPEVELREAISWKSGPEDQPGALLLLETPEQVDIELCHLCGSRGFLPSFVYCSQCAEPYHPYCCTMRWGSEDKSALEGFVDVTWRCERCTVCEVCGSADPENQLLLCQDCHRAYHTFCNSPPLKAVPTGQWKCDDCVFCISCGTTSPQGKWMEDYTLCTPCGRLHNAGNYCPMCNGVHADAQPEVSMIQCEDCERWIHSTCDGVNDVVHEDLTRDDRRYKCPLCREEPPSHWAARIRRSLRMSYATAGLPFPLGGVFLPGALADPLAMSVSPPKQLDYIPKSLIITLSMMDSVEDPDFIQSHLRYWRWRGRREWFNVDPHSDDEPEVKAERSMAREALAVPFGSGHVPYTVSSTVALGDIQAMRLAASRLEEIATPSKDEFTVCPHAERHGSEDGCESGTDGETEDGVGGVTKPSTVGTASEANDQSAVVSILSRSGSPEVDNKRDSITGGAEQGVDASKEGAATSSPAATAANAEPASIAPVEIPSDADDDVTIALLAEKERLSPLLDGQYSDASPRDPRPDSADAMKVVVTLADDAADATDWVSAIVKPQSSFYDLDHEKSTVALMLQEKGSTQTLESKQDVRRCCLCGLRDGWRPNRLVEHGGAVPGEGRLMFVETGMWIHVDCALWSNDVQLSSRGVLVNVNSCLVHARSSTVRCAHCKRWGATVRCCQKGCRDLFHLPCIYEIGGSFFSDLKTYCYVHRDSRHTKKNVTRVRTAEIIGKYAFPATALQVPPLPILQALLGGQFAIRVGALTIHSIGLPVNKPAYKPSICFPVGFKSTRRFWSSREVGKTVLYNCEVDCTGGGSSSKPLFTLSCVEEEFEVTVTNPDDAWRRVVSRVNECRRKKYGAANALPRKFPIFSYPPGAQTPTCPSFDATRRPDGGSKGVADSSHGNRTVWARHRQPPLLCYTKHVPGAMLFGFNLPPIQGILQHFLSIGREAELESRKKRLERRRLSGEGQDEVPEDAEVDGEEGFTGTSDNGQLTGCTGEIVVEELIAPSPSKVVPVPSADTSEESPRYSEDREGREGMGRKRRRTSKYQDLEDASADEGDTCSPAAHGARKRRNVPGGKSSETEEERNPVWNTNGVRKRAKSSGRDCKIPKEEDVVLDEDMTSSIAAGNGSAGLIAAVKQRTRKRKRFDDE